jgi:hypothetical protein
MRIDPLQQYSKLRQQLTEEKSQLESRLAEINQVLGPASEIPSASATAQAVAASTPRRGRPPKNTMSMREIITKALTERGPLSRKELGQAVVDLGYRSKAKNVLGSIGNLLYGKNSPFKSKGGKFHLSEGGGAALGEGADHGDGFQGEVPSPRKRKRRKMSPEGRARIAAAARARWAKVKRSK